MQDVIRGHLLGKMNCDGNRYRVGLQSKFINIILLILVSIQKQLKYFTSIEIKSYLDIHRMTSKDSLLHQIEVQHHLATNLITNQEGDWKVLEKIMKN